LPAVAAVAVVTDGGGGNEHAGRFLQAHQRLGEEPRTLRATLQNRLLLLGGPAQSEEALAGQVPDRVTTLEARGVQDLRGGIPAC
jgi:hypothetical protein